MQRQVLLSVVFLVIGLLCCVANSLYTERSAIDKELLGRTSSSRTRSRSSSALGWEPYQWSSWGAGPNCPRRAGRTLVPNLPTQSGPLAEALPAISSLLDSLVANYSALLHGQFGGQIGLIYGDQVLLTHGAGTTQFNNTQVPTADTIFSMGSVTKIFTSFLLMKLIDDGVVTIDQPVTDFFNAQTPPIFAPVNPYGDQTGKVTLRALASHTSGLPREPVCGAFDACQTTNIEELIISTINGIPLFSSPLTAAHYSNLGIGLLSRCLERAVSKKLGHNVLFEDYLTWEVLEALLMNDTGFHYTDAVKSRMATGYTITNGAQTVDLSFARDLGWETGCGGLHTTTNDMLKFLASLRPGKSLLHQNSLLLYGAPSFEMPDGLSGFGVGTWEKLYANGYQVLTKGGLIGGFGTSLVYVPELQLGLVTWVNLESGSIPDEIAAKAFNIIVPALESALAAAQPKPTLPATYKTILGAYGVTSPLVSIAEVAPGVLKGMAFGYPVVWTWETAVQTPATVYAFRYRIDIPEGKGAPCFLLDSIGEDAVAYFFTTAKGTYVSVPDQGAWNIPPMK